LSQCRLKLSRLIHANLLTEEREFIAPLRRHPRSGELADFAGVVATTNDLRLAYSEHVQRWPLRAIDLDIAGYSASVNSLIEAVTHLLKRKSKLLPAAARLLDEAPVA
jgi:hypothetical protein